MSFEVVFEPMKIGKLTIKNRMIVAPMGTDLPNPEGFVSSQAIDYYEARAKGGFGMIITEGTCVNKRGRVLPFQPFVYDDKFIPDLRRLASAIRRHGCRAFLQIHHAGRQTNSSITGETPVAPSPIPCPLHRQTPEEMTTDEVYGIIDSFIQAAIRAQKAGFDGVEVHAAHGYLLSQFISPRMNKRFDEFGGDLEGRTYILKLILKGIKRECGEDFPLTVRVNLLEGGAGGYLEHEALVFAKLVESYGADAFHVSAGSYGNTNLTTPSPDTQHMTRLETTRALKELLSIPLITVGRFDDPHYIDYVLKTGNADFVSVGRPSIADPELPNKMFAGELQEIVPCMSCSSRCFSVDDPFGIGDAGISCTVNPLSSNRAELRITPTEKPKKVMVVGSGPAGLEAAWIAAARGHAVTLYEKAPRNKAGGQFRIAAYPPYKQAISAVLRHYLYMCEKHGVELVFGQEVDAGFIRGQSPDALVIATGGVPITPNFKGIDKAPVSQANDVLTGEVVPAGSVLVVGGGEVGLETADFCTDYCSKVTVVEMRPQMAPEMNFNVLMDMCERFRKGGKVELLTGAKVLELTGDGAICERDGKTMTLSGYSSVILAIGSTAYNPFSDCQELAEEVYVVGDAKKARTATQAFFEGAKVAVSI